jgi:HEAT repeat protein
MSFLSRGGLSNLAGVIFAVYAATVAAHAQQASASGPSTAELVEQLNSDEPVVRNDALELLRSNPDALGDPKVKVALISLLDRENRVTWARDDEGYSEYVSWLSQTVANVVDWSDQRQVCILAHSAYLQDELASHAKVSIPCLLQRFGTVPHAFRGEVAAMMVQALAKGRNDLDPATIEAVQKATLSALHDTEKGVRIDTIEGLGKFGTEDMIPALKAVAEADPAPEVHGHSVRKRAAEAFVQIQKRAGQRPQ